MAKYDYLIVGAGLFGAVFAHQAISNGKRCLVLEKRNHVGGNIYCESKEGINIHKYGPHIFHTNNRCVWDYINQFSEFNNFINTPIANYKGECYSLPFNMNTFNKMWGCIYPSEAQKIIDKQRISVIGEPKNLEEQAISLVGKDIYEKLIKEYTEKQWGRDCKDLPAFIIKRLPVRYTYNSNYFDDKYQGIPIEGYNSIIEKMLVNCDIELSVDYNMNKDIYKKYANVIVYTGAIDSYYDYIYGNLEYRSLCFETTRENIPNYQGVAVMNFTSMEVPYTRIIEHKHFEFGTQMYTYITKEFSSDCEITMEPYYPINDLKNQELYSKYETLAKKEKNVIFGGRLAEYKYYNMDQIIDSAMNMFK